ncbi:hypothetical protein D3C86_1377280 [compost metagenome]
MRVDEVVYCYKIESGFKFIPKRQFGKKGKDQYKNRKRRKEPYEYLISPRADPPVGHDSIIHDGCQAYESHGANIKK